MLCAVTVVLLLVGSLFSTLDLTAAAAGSVLILVAVIELGPGFSFGIYAASALLSLLLLPQKSAAVIFAAFAGFYPIVKVYLNRIRPKALSYLARLALFNALYVLMILAATKLFGIADDLFVLGWIAFLLGNVTFIVYDFALERLSVFYCVRLKGLRNAINGRRHQ